ncbi:MULTISPECIES: hypothetical protein [unclassified Streptococcus]|uniref:hypothetical protein n=1 Tax=unclassified Streptococcus TaxID=2608887 RepID=UPI0008A65782|nr:MULTISPECIES: hypothetical protein [unclassified Streptococcus]OFN92093.1 hypothetical protein HMPREF2686_07515 [Streptococcus sp. HMSC057G03]OFQ88664.1 hypothetical protein HMPREF2917_03570 [Streptococcus sp. HMSC061E03]
MVVDLKSYLEKILIELGVDTLKNREKVSGFLLDNDWFGVSINLENYTTTDEDAKVLKNHIKDYFMTPPGVESMGAIFAKKFPSTSDLFIQFSKEQKLTKTNRFYLLDFLAYYLTKDLFLYSNAEVEKLVEVATEVLTKYLGDNLIQFIKWLLDKGVTRYRVSFEMTKRYTIESTNGAYELDEYLQLMYYLFNEEYITRNNMYSKAADSKNYADAWLYLALHFICALRTTDLMRLGHPKLNRKPKEVLEAVASGSWSSSEARRTLLSITTRLTYLNITPNKTSRASNVTQLKFQVPESCQVLIGTLLAICEAHYQISSPYSSKTSSALIRRISTYEQISNYMGDEIGNLFLERNFSSRSANKSYLQSVAMLADDILEEKSELNIKGYFLAALARSHKGDFNEFAQTTTTYLKDAQLGQLKPEMVAKELFERGVLSMIPSMLLTIVTRGKYKELSPNQQTQMIKSLDLTPAEIEKTLELSIRADLRSQQALKTLIENNVGADQLLTVCHRIGNGEAFSKQGESMCLLSALGKLCPYDDRQHCVGCQFELQTKSTLLLLIGEFNRLNKQYSKLKNDLERGKVRAILEKQIKPCLTEMLQALSEQYGEDVLSDYEDIIKELVN